MKLTARLTLAFAFVLGSLTVVSGASAATISPATWNYGSLLVGQVSPPQSFVTTGQVGDDYTGGSSLLGYNPDAFRILSDGCQGVHIGPGTSCTVSVVFAPTDDTISGDMDAVLVTWPYTGLATQARADLLGNVADEPEGGGGNRPGAGGSPQAKKKCKKIKNKAKRKKCLKKQQGSGGKSPR